MKSFLQCAGGVALLVFSVAIAVASYDAHQFLSRSNSMLADLDTVIKEQNAHLTEEEIHIDDVLETVRTAATEQRAYWQKTSADSDKTVKALRVTIDRAGLLLKHTDENQSLIAMDVDHQINATAESAQMSLSSFDHFSDALAFQVNELDVSTTLGNFDESSARLVDAMGNLRDASAHADKILLDGEKTADYYEKRLTTPASFAHRVVMGVLDVGSKLGNIMAGFVK